MRTLALLFLPALAWADPPTLTLNVGVAAGSATELKPLAYSPELKLYLVERNDKRPNGSERSWNFYARDLELLGYVVLTTEAGVSDEHVQWLAAPNPPASTALAELATKAREKLKGDGKGVDAAWAAWQKVKPASCPLRAVKHDRSVDLMAQSLRAATIDTPISEGDAKRGCTPAQPGPLRCVAGAEGDLIVIAPFKQDCQGPIAQQLAFRYNAHDLEYLKEAQLGETALKKGDVAGAWKHLERSIELEATYPPAHELHACAAAKSGVAFAKGRAELEPILGSEEARQKFLPLIQHEPCFAAWRADPDFKRWLAEFPTRTPIP